MSSGASGIVKRSVAIHGHRTSISLETPFWDAFKEIACRRGVSVQALVREIDAGRGEQNLSSAIRVFVLNAVRPEPQPPGTEGRTRGAG